MFGPLRASELSRKLAMPRDLVDQALAQLEAEGQILRGQFTASAGIPIGATDGTPTGEAPAEVEWCHRRLLARIHRLTIGRLRREIEPVSTAAFFAFLHRWQHLSPGSQLHGADGTLQIIRQLQGCEFPAAAWESEILPRRVAQYSPEYLDQLCLSGEVSWGRLSPHPAFDRVIDEGAETTHRRSPRPTRVAPLAIFLREDAAWLLAPPVGPPQGGQAPRHASILPPAAAHAQVSSHLPSTDASHLPLADAAPASPSMHLPPAAARAQASSHLPPTAASHLPLADAAPAPSMHLPPTAASAQVSSHLPSTDASHLPLADAGPARPSTQRSPTDAPAQVSNQRPPTAASHLPLADAAPAPPSSHLSPTAARVSASSHRPPVAAPAPSSQQSRDRQGADPPLASTTGTPRESLSHPARELLAVLESRGASFFADLTRATGRLASEVEDGLWELVVAGLVTADGFENLRALLDPKRRAGLGKGRLARPRHAPGRWDLLRHTQAQPEGQAAAFAKQLLARWGVLFRDAVRREPLAPPWRDLLVELRRMESRGEIRGGRFLDAYLGEQFALPEALDLLRSIRRTGETAAVPEGPGPWTRSRRARNRRRRYTANFLSQITTPVIAIATSSRLESDITRCPARPPISPVWIERLKRIQR